MAPYGVHLSQSQIMDVAKLQEFSDVFLPLPGQNNLKEHHIATTTGVVVRDHPYPLPKYKKSGPG